MTTKTVWFYSGCAMVLGLVLAVIGFFSGASLTNVTFGKNGFQVADTTPHTINQENLDVFNSMDLDIKDGNVEFVPSDHYGVLITYFGDEDQYSCTEKSGTLIINDKKSQSDISFFNFGFSPLTSQNTVKIYMPKTAVFQNIKIKNSYGDLAAGNFTSNSTDIQLPFGKLSLTNADCGTASFTLGNGESRLQNIKTNSLIFKNSFGRSSFENITVASEGKAKIDAQNGSVSINNFNAGFLELNDSFGGVTLNTLNLSQFKSKIGNGALKIENSSIETSEIEDSFGGIYITGLESNGASIKSGNGKIVLEGALKGKNIIQSNLGGVSVKTSVEQSKCSYNLSSKLGDVKLNGEKIGSNKVQSTDSEISLSISSNNGSVSLDFQK